MRPAGGQLCLQALLHRQIGRRDQAAVGLEFGPNGLEPAHQLFVGGPLTDGQTDQMRRFLEVTLEAGADASTPLKDPVTRGPHLLATDVGDEDGRLWLADLTASKMTAQLVDAPDGRELRLENAQLETIEDLEAARVTLGEILAEAGHEDWDARALLALLHLG